MRIVNLNSGVNFSFSKRDSLFQQAHIYKRSSLDIFRIARPNYATMVSCQVCMRLFPVVLSRS